MVSDNKSGITQMSMARRGIVTEEIRVVASKEGISAETLMQRVAKGTVAIPANPLHRSLDPIGVGEKLHVKINANIGNSETTSCITEEIEKLHTSIKYGSDAIMDLSTGSDIDNIRQAIIAESTIPVGTVPLYQSSAEVRHIFDLTTDDFIAMLEHQAKQGVDFMTIHAGLLREFLGLIRTRTAGIVSRGGSLLADWMQHYGRQNPFYEHFDRVLDVCRAYDVTISLGDGLRPGCLADANDEAQISELKVLGELTKRAWERDVQIMIEGPGHVPMHLIEENVRLEKKYCHNAPFYVLGPLVTDIAPGYDHITGAIGSAIAGAAGADFLCYVTPKEHLGLPEDDDVRTGIIAFKLAAHAADIARGVPHAMDRDNELSRARMSFDWEKQFSLALDPERAREYRSLTMNGQDFTESEWCSMCGNKYCAIRITTQVISRMEE